jgi:hypothetical protein
MDSTPTTDNWNCKWCGHDWVIPLDAPVGPGPAADRVPDGSDPEMTGAGVG